MTHRVDLIWLGSAGDPPVWNLGEVWSIPALADAINEVFQQVGADAWLLWDARLQLPDAALIKRCLMGSGDLWHAGLKSGMCGQPKLIDKVAPTWMLNCDPPEGIEASSWRISLRACLMRSEVVRQMGGLAPGFQSLDGAGLEFGHRCIMRGVIMRHVPTLLRQLAQSEGMTFEDELRFIHHRFGGLWRDWAAARAVMSGDIPLKTVWQARKALRDEKRSPNVETYRAASRMEVAEDEIPAVSVIIPTLDRYPYLETLLDHLQRQTLWPKEIIVIDQTEADARDESIWLRHSDLPLMVIMQEEAGQCTARNLAIERATGEYLLFIDDDDEVPPRLIEDHWRNLQRFKTAVSCGGVDEVGAGLLPDEFRYTQVSSVFPTNNTMIRREGLKESGLFDETYNRTFMDDADLGMRLYLSGALMIYDPAIRVMHHHALSGGLRTYRQRAITYASSRARITHRNLPSVSEIYYPMRYFTAQQVRESLWLRILGTFSIRGGWIKRLAKVVVSGILLPHTLWVIWWRYRWAQRLQPQIPRLGESTAQR